ncbi:hypothetical protein GWK47_018461 [Chionoecetes opilio]|uniref:Platelet-derived growth factor (PDGF) family profile domain-containing protein n=1 Tax=Chionoecetes opilio TaxID=41210 RepID=A0A8J4XV33_CHIOP|nr:hypothetical protein GWK47_018461 [Chionoecetes opilio]
MSAPSNILVVVALLLFAGTCVADEESMLREQRTALAKLQCEPKETWAYIGSHLPVHDDLLNKDYYPHVVTVRRCLEECSFCGDPITGVSDKTCQVDTTGPKRVVVRLFNDDELTRNITLIEHKTCKCM